MTARKNSTVSSGAARRAGGRAFSLIEVVMAGTLLAMTASAVVAGITTVVTADGRNQQKLEALELANRLLLQYVDDKTAMPQESAHVLQGRGVYRWSIDVSPAQLSMPAACVVEAPTDGPGSATLGKLALVSVSVHAGVPDGMGGYAAGERLCTLSRVYHPLSTVYRNPNTMAIASGDPGKIAEIFRELLDAAPAPRAAVERHAGAFAGTRKEGR